MVDQLISAVVSWIVEVISAAGYFGVVALMAIEFGMHSIALRGDHAVRWLSRVHWAI